MKWRARFALASLGWAAITAALALGCTETRRGLGDACLKGDDCLSGYCSAQVCSAAPPLATGTTSVPPGPDGATPSDASSSDTGSGDGATVDDASDSGPLADADDAG